MLVKIAEWFYVVYKTPVNGEGEELQKQADIAHFKVKGKSIIYRAGQALGRLKSANNHVQEFVIQRGNIHFPV
jgi:hypothetical protein